MFKQVTILEFLKVKTSMIALFIHSDASGWCFAFKIWSRLRKTCSLTSWYLRLSIVFFLCSIQKTLSFSEPSQKLSLPSKSRGLSHIGKTITWRLPFQPLLNHSNNKRSEKQIWVGRDKRGCEIKESLSFLPLTFSISLFCHKSIFFDFCSMTVSAAKPWSFFSGSENSYW